MNEQEIHPYYHVKMDLEGKDNTFLIIKVAKPNSNIDKILKSLKPYLEKFYYYALEILILFLFPSLIKILPSKSGVTKKILDENKSALQNLKNSENYSKEFNHYISKVIQGSFYLSPNI